ncbi:MAG: hypothetical protein IPL96_14030 [Holophagaceae bacterium]|nr:hypothetical protein [Holophagaceae bacterium]
MPVIRTALVLAALAALPAAADTQKKSPVAAQGEAAQKKADIKRYLMLSEGVKRQVDSARRSVAGMKKGSSKEIPESFWVDLEKSVTPEAFEAAMAEVYDKKYTAQEMREIVKLIDNPVFKKFSQIEQTEVQKAVGEALQRVMEENSKRLMPKHQAAKAGAKAEAPKADTKKN